MSVSAKENKAIEALRRRFKTIRTGTDVSDMFAFGADLLELQSAEALAFHYELLRARAGHGGQHPQAFSDRGLIFAGAYFAMQVWRTAFIALQLPAGHPLALN